MVIKPTNFEQKYGINFQRLDKEIKWRRQITIILGIFWYVLELVFLLGIVFIGIFIYNLIF